MARDTDKEFAEGMKKLKNTAAAAKQLKGLYESSNKSSKPKSKPVMPKNPNRSIKVSQSEIDSIKKMGMKKALSSAKTGSSSFGEGVRRLYGETRYQNAIYTPKASPGPIGMGKSSVMSAKPKSNFTYQTGMSSPKKNTYQTGQNSPKAKPKAIPKIAAKPKAKSKNVAGFKPGSIGAKAIGSFKKAYLGK